MNTMVGMRDVVLLHRAFLCTPRPPERPLGPLRPNPLLHSLRAVFAPSSNPNAAPAWQCPVRSDVRFRSSAQTMPAPCPPPTPVLWFLSSFIERGGGNANAIFAYFFLHFYALQFLRSFFFLHFFAPRYIILGIFFGNMWFQVGFPPFKNMSDDRPLSGPRFFSSNYWIESRSSSLNPHLTIHNGFDFPRTARKNKSADLMSDSCKIMFYKNPSSLVV